MKNWLIAPLGATVALTLAFPAVAQDDAGGKVDWTGPYVGGSLGYSWGGKTGREQIGFDTNGDGVYDNTVTTAAGANAFSPGFCGGSALGNSAAQGCRKDKDGTNWSIHAGYDRQFGNIVAGAVVEGGKNYIRDSVTAFSTTPASYTMTRQLGWNGALRARLGYTTDSGIMVYGTGGAVYGKVKNSFTSTNTANRFTVNNASDKSWGWTAGGGIEAKVSQHFSVGALYKYTRFDAGDSTVTVTQGTAPATNPFIITPSGSTDFARRSRFNNQSVMATASFRF